MNILGKKLESYRYFILTSLFFVFSVGAEPRTALLIGNASYNEGSLRNPVNDAKDIGNLLNQAGFDTKIIQNATQQEMEESIREFGSEINKKGGVGLFYYAGHGMQINGDNYLIPVSNNIKKETDVKYKAVNMGLVLDEMGSARNGLNIVILDACRDNPLARSFRSSTRGLARADGPDGTLIAYATAPGRLASDGRGSNSVFTKHLLSAMAVPNISLERVFKNVTRGVNEETNGNQTPWISSSFMGDFSFFGNTSSNSSSSTSSYVAPVVRPAPAPTMSGSTYELSPEDIYRKFQANPSAYLNSSMKIKAPDIAENGALIPVTMNFGDSSRKGEVYLFVSSNVEKLAVKLVYHESSPVYLSTRVKMTETGGIIAIYVDDDGSIYAAKKEVKVTAGYTPRNISGKSIDDIKIKAKVKNNIMTMKFLFRSTMSKNKYIEKITMKVSGVQIATLFTTPYISKNPYFAMKSNKTLGSVKITAYGNDGKVESGEASIK